MFKLLTERAEFLMKGGEPPELDAKFPPSDSGILGPVVTPDNLTVTVALGSSLFDDRFGLKPLKPKLLQRMTGFPNDALQKDICHGDLVIQFCSNTPDTNIHALRDIMKNMPDLLMVRWKQEGRFRCNRRIRPGRRKAHETSSVSAMDPPIRIPPMMH